MLSVDRRPQWRAIRGGSARYVEKLVAPFRDRIRLNTPARAITRSRDGVRVKTEDAAAERFDHIFLACHSDEALALLVDASPLEREVLGAIRYQQNEAVLHTDTAAAAALEAGVGRMELSCARRGPAPRWRSPTT